MNYILNYLWESSICLFLLYSFYLVFLANHTFFGWNRAYILLSMGIVLILPILSFKAVFANDLPILTSDLIHLLPEFSIGPGSGSTLFSFSVFFQLLIGVYFPGVIIGSLQVTLGLFRICKQIRQTSESYRHHGQTILVSPGFQPSSFFHYIFLPEYDPADHEHQLILSHECLHSAYYHTTDSLLFQLFKIVFWFHPMIHRWGSSLFEIHEYQVDHEVTKTNSKGHYASLLLKLVTADRGKELLNNFNQCQIKKRIIMMGRKKSNLLEKSRFLLVIPLLGLLIAMFSCEGQEYAELMGEAETTQAMGGEVFDVVEDMPFPPGGMDGWNQYLSNNLSYPAQARYMGIEGTVFVEFVVNADGSIRDVEILRGIGTGCDEEALRVIKNSPNWEPGKQKDRKVNVRIIVPIKFKLGS